MKELLDFIAKNSTHPDDAVFAALLGGLGFTVIICVTVCSVVKSITTAIRRR